jgi:hypothetical protein
MPLAQLDADELAAREELMQLEIKGLDQRLAALKTPAAPSRARFDEVLNALAAAGDESVKAEAARLKAEGAAAVAPLTPQAFDARRKQLLALLDAVEAADPSLKPRVEDLRRRIIALVPGDSTQDVLTRARTQREEELARIRDERVLRGSGAQPPASALLLGEQRALQTAIADVEAQIKVLDEGPPVATDVSEADRTRKTESLRTLTAACVKCHVMSGAAMARVRAAKPVLVRAGFVHQPHLLQTDCARCHAGIEKSPAASDLNFKGVQSCRECHSTGVARQDCLSCHRYHPPAVP